MILIYKKLSIPINCAILSHLLIKFSLNFNTPKILQMDSSGSDRDSNLDWEIIADIINDDYEEELLHMLLMQQQGNNSTVHRSKRKRKSKANEASSSKEVLQRKKLMNKPK
ncbi:hypothetical protein MtrunA17_Chr3g0140271 [Medicago truncatula]|uniref:Uncharacterized protein n=1 Tax=Medicago truncatula TaxID=3880 RepID=A0A396IYP6_MEDTR|nr:hypothetical protein MtrunA17_Chr3g0140271 [Medicago truncatula]